MEKKETPKPEQVVKIFNSIIKLNDWSGNQWLINNLQWMYTEWIQSQACEECSGDQRQAITIVFFDLLEVLRNSNGLSETTGLNEKNNVLINPNISLN